MFSQANLPTTLNLAKCKMWTELEHWTRWDSWIGFDSWCKIWTVLNSWTGFMDLTFGLDSLNLELTSYIRFSVDNLVLNKVIS